MDHITDTQTDALTLVQGAHTPGPWRIINGDLRNTKMYQIVGPVYARHKLSMADITLVSHAPDLLAEALAWRTAAPTKSTYASTSDLLDVQKNRTPGDWKMLNHDLRNIKMHQKVGPVLPIRAIKPEDVLLIALSGKLLDEVLDWRAQHKM